MGALDGVRVLDLTWGIAGPAGGLMLAGPGADVVKVEPPDGSRSRAWPASRVWDRSRRSVELDLKGEEGRENFLRLVGTADVLVESMRPRAMTALGLDHGALADSCPQLVYVSVP